MEEMSVFATLLSAHRLSIDRVYHIVRSMGKKDTVLVQRYNCEETSHITIPSEQQLQMKTDQLNLFYSNLLQMHSITTRE